MPRYSKSDIQELKEFLYNSHVHDAKFESIKYDRKESALHMVIVNPISDVKMNLTFLNTAIVLATKGDWSENRETILALVVEEDFSYLQNQLLEHSEYREDSLYLLFQMFSGDELHIVSKEVMVEMVE